MDQLYAKIVRETGQEIERARKGEGFERALDKPRVWLPVEQQSAPSYNSLTQRLVAFKTLPDLSLETPVDPEAKIVEGWNVESKSLADVKAAKLALLAAQRYSVEIGGMTHNGAPVDTDDRAKTLIIGARIKAKENASYTRDWKVAPGTYVTLDAPALIALGDALDTFVGDAFANEQAHAAAINALTTAAEVAAYDFTTGWPE